MAYVTQVTNPGAQVKSLLTLVGIAVAGLPTLCAQTLTGALPLTERILLVTFDDGSVDYHGPGETFADDVVTLAPLDLAAATDPDSYTLRSLDDPAYATPQRPTRINRKSRPNEFAGFCLADDGAGVCVNPVPDHTSEHALYLHLPSPLTDGAAYTLSFPGLAGQADVTWTRDDAVQRSEAVHANLIGYAPSAGEKYGYVYHWLGDGGSLRLGDAARAFTLVEVGSGAVAFSGQVAFRKDSTAQEFAYAYQSPPFGNLLGSRVWECDFSGFRQNGAYRLCVEGVGCSFPFDIGDEVYREPLDLTLRGLYQQRSGIALETPYADVARPAPHHPGRTPGFAGRLKYSSISASAYDDFDIPAGQADEINAAVQGELDAWGWYQDAGDWDAYARHAEVPMQLLWLYEMHADKWGDAQLNLPERGNGLPDLLDEALWLPRFYHRLRAELTAEGYGTGGLGGSRIFADINGSDRGPNGELRGSWQDTDRDWIVSGEDAPITYSYAGLAAHVAVLLRQRGLTDPAGIDWAAEAVSAYAWAAANETAADLALTGADTITHERAYAAANLFRLTGDAAYERAFARAYGESLGDDLQQHVLWAYAAYRAAADEQAADADLVARVAQTIQDRGAFWDDFSRDDRATRWGGNYFLPVLVGQPTTPLVQPIVVAHYFAAADDPAAADARRDALYATADYFLGANPLNHTWVTGLGERSPRQAFNLDSWVLQGDGIRSGITPYGAWHSSYMPPNAFIGPYHPLWPFQFAYPVGEDAWPAHERWFDQRPAPLGGEYTVDQNMAPPILLYGYLYGLTAPDFVPSSTQPAFAKTRTLEVVPNPSSGAIQLRGLGAATVTVFAAQGRLVREVALSQNQPLDLGDVPAGVYVLRARDAAGVVWTGRVVRE